MNRKEEAHLSQSSISHNKIIYVEGNLDYKIIREFLEFQNITGVRVTEVSTENIIDVYGAKKQVISIIKKANNEKVSSKCIGVVDLDYDFFDECILDIPNLLYTDYNSIESYFLKLDLLNKLLADYNLQKIDTELFEKWKSNSLLISSWFYFQISQITNLNVDEQISFKKLRLDNKEFVNYKQQRIKLDNIVTHKTKCEDKLGLKSKYVEFVKTLDRIKIYNNEALFLHGKHTFKFFVSLLHKRDRKLKSLSYENLECILKDKFILHFANSESLFEKIIDFTK